MSAIKELWAVLVEGVHNGDLGGLLREWWQVARGRVTPETRAAMLPGRHGFPDAFIGFVGFMLDEDQCGMMERALGVRAKLAHTAGADMPNDEIMAILGTLAPRDLSFVRGASEALAVQAKSEPHTGGPRGQVAFWLGILTMCAEHLRDELGGCGLAADDFHLCRGLMAGLDVIVDEVRTRIDRTEQGLESDAAMTTAQAVPAQS
jgi:hypothetical protein